MRQFRHRSYFRPFQGWIRFLSIEPLERSDAHSGIYEHIVNRLGPNHDNIRLCDQWMRSRERKKNPKTAIRDISDEQRIFVRAAHKYPHRTRHSSSPFSFRISDAHSTAPWSPSSIPN